MSRDFAQVANDVITGVGATREVAPGRYEGVCRPFYGSHSHQRYRHKNEGAHGAGHQHRGPLRRFPPYIDGFTAEQYKYGPFGPIRQKLKELTEAAQKPK